MSLNFWIHVSARLPAGIDTDTVRAREILLSALRDEGIDDMLPTPPSRGLARHTGIDGAPRLVCGSTHPVVLRGDEEAFARRLAADIESSFSAAGIEAKAAVVLREDETGDDARRFQTAVLHYIDSDLGDELEGARDRMSPELFPRLVARYAALETWDQRAELIFLCGQRPSPVLEPLWRDLLLSAIDTRATSVASTSHSRRPSTD